MDALIGRTGFVGQTLLAQRDFGASYRSTDIATIEGRHFGRIVCAGVSAVKWWANANPEADRAAIERLMRHLDKAEADVFVLISTVDVYGTPLGVDETVAVPGPGLHPYGLHRAMLEDWVRERFPRHHIIRLPALFGAGLKKNALFDLLHDNMLEKIDSKARFQWYPLERLADDIDVIETAGLDVVNLATEPVAMGEIQKRFFPDKILGSTEKPALYDMRTRYGALFGGNAEYAMSAETVLAAMGRFVAASR